MDCFKSDFLKLIQSAVNNIKYNISSDFSFEEAYKIAVKHNVAPLLFYGAVNCGFDSSCPVMQKLFKYTCKNIIIDEGQKAELEKIFKEFDDKLIEYMPLKGILIKDIYPKPEMRIMNDADILIKSCQYKKIKKVLKSLNFTKVAESDHEIIWDNKLLLLELHKRLIPSYNKDYYAYFKDGWAKAEKDKGTRYLMSKEDMFIYLFIHFAKHYRDSGVGIKYIIDFWIYRNTYKDLDEAYIEKELKKLRVYEFYINILNTIDVWFNNAVSDPKVEMITDTVFKSGTFGTYKAHLLSTALKNRKQNEPLALTKLKRIFNMLFPSYNVLSNQYRYLKKFPVLYPFVIIYRAFDKIFSKKNSAKRILAETNFVTKEKVDNYQKNLNFVGLDFNFKE